MASHPAVCRRDLRSFRSFKPARTQRDVSDRQPLTGRLSESDAQRARSTLSSNYLSQTGHSCGRLGDIRRRSPHDACRIKVGFVVLASQVAGNRLVIKPKSVCTATAALHTRLHPQPIGHNVRGAVLRGTLYAVRAAREPGYTALPACAGGEEVAVQRMRPRFRQCFEGILSRWHQPEPAGAPTGHWQRHGRALVPVLRSKARSRPFLHPPQSGKEAVRIVCMDLSSTYRAMVRKHIPTHASLLRRHRGI